MSLLKLNLTADYDGSAEIQTAAATTVQIVFQGAKEPDISERQARLRRLRFFHSNDADMPFEELPFGDDQENGTNALGTHLFSVGVGDRYYVQLVGMEPSAKNVVNISIKEI